jgi:hypothetical protein
VQHTRIVGERTEGIVLGELLKRGYIVSLPFGGSQRYDFILDDGNRLLKAQCKTGHIRNGAIVFNTCSVNGLTRVKTDYRDQIDVFIIYNDTIGKVYIVPVNEVGKCEGSLRVEPASKRVKNARMAQDFELKDLPPKHKK